VAPARTKSIYTARYKRFKELLCRYREQAGLTQTQLAEAVGRPQSFVSKIESGERRLDIVELLQLLAVVGVDPKRFIDDLIRRGINRE